MKIDVSAMTLREKIAQTLMVRQPDLLLRADRQYGELRDPSEARQLMTRYQFGAIWASGNQDVNFMSEKYNGYFGFTAGKYLEWLNDTVSGLKIPPLVANDVTGRDCCSDLSIYPRGLIVGACNSEEMVYELGRCIALEHQALGITWLWSPNSDIHCRLSDSINRCFSNRPDQLAALNRAFARGMQSAGTAATAKHFPGPNAMTVRDSHVTSNVSNISLEEWRKAQGPIFQALIDDGVMAVMPNAKAMTAIESSTVNGQILPTGLSSKALIDLLKTEMGFEGVVITDDVNMGGYTSCYGHDELYGRMLAAGNDMLLGVGLDAVDIVEDCVKRGIVTEERITDACTRVLRLKEKLGLLDDGYVRGRVDLEEVKRRTAAIGKAIAEKGVTLVRNRNGLLPLKQKPRHVSIFLYSHAPEIYDDLQTMKQAFESRGAEVSLHRRPGSFDEIAGAAEKSDLIIYAGFIGHFAPKGMPGFYGDEFWALRYAFTAGREKSMGISMGYPFIHAFFMNDADTFANLYSPSPEVQKAFVAAVYGEIDFAGTAPLDMESPIEVSVL